MLIWEASVTGAEGKRTAAVARNAKRRGIPNILIIEFFEQTVEP
jgi:hypothetical protein